MSPTLLLLVPPFALLVWRGDWPSTLALVAVSLLVAYLDWRATKTDWNGSVSVDIDQANHAIRTLTQRVDALVLADSARPSLEPALRRLKTAEEALERHAQLLAKQSQRSGVL